ncbi:protein CEBPZOS [Drosophila rhopaloa]|uniref:Protein CEBPZOS n=1 Tax=Drosophila rhopaloa TaxID=1041015 RepID=A0A6P4E537_DRORH|nr:protein CEBPZOS [Drosophila rhopaloa]
MMLPKTPKPAIWKFIKGSAKTLFVLEAVCFAASYGVYYRMNTNREFRQHIHENYPFVLDYYYKIGEIVGDSSIRQTDASYWSGLKKSD